MSTSLIHDEAMKIAALILGVFNLREEEKREAFEMIYDRVKLGLELYEIKADRMQKRLHLLPSKN